MMSRALLALFALASAALAPAAAAPVRTENVEAELHLSHQAVMAGERFTAALRLKMRPGWHTYWINPGDSGEPTEIAWSLPAGFVAGDILWPAPSLEPTGPIINYGYEGEILLPVEITAPKEASGTVTLEADARWLVCADICIPEAARLTAEVTIGADRLDPIWADRIAKAVAGAPQPAPGLTAHLSAEPDGAFLLTAKGGPLTEGARSAHFFPISRDAIDHSADQQPRTSAEGVALTLTPQPEGTLGASALSGVLKVELRRNGGWVEAAYAVEATPGEPLVSAANAAPAQPRQGGGAPQGLLAAALFAFVGGLILNVMPCVFPVLSIKALSFAATPAAEARRHGVFFTLGVLATFLALAGLLIGLQAAGAKVGWGFQLQEPLVVGALALVFFTIGLNLLGAFEVGGSLQGVGGGLAARSGASGAFFTGALAVVAASPCTAPFMGGALGFAATQPPVVSLAVFAALGLGFAAPFATLSFIPAARRLLPKPGAWMDAFKQALAFPMFATAVWLAWVLTQQSGAAGALAVLSAALAVSFFVWAMRAFRGAGARIAAGGLAFAALALAVRALPAGDASAVQERPREEAGLASERWTGERVEAALAQGSPVFVNFTADWCVTCKLNEAAALARPEVAAAFERAGVLYLKGDWTVRDAAITEELARHGRAGVPLYLLYRPGSSEPVILPQLLTPQIIMTALEGGAQTGSSTP